MADTYVFERGVVLICQCLPPCHAAWRDGDAWSLVGCLREKGHDGDHGLDGPTGGFAYRDPVQAIGPRIVLRLGMGGSYFGTCPRCLREYAMNVISYGAEAAATIREDAP